MALELIGLLLGLVLVVIKMMTGTFYLLTLGLTAFIASGVAYAGGSSGFGQFSRRRPPSREASR
jgi:membrane protein implicated in regulation of membrane protease activity